MTKAKKRRVWLIYSLNKGEAGGEFRFFADSREDAEYHCQCLKRDGWLITTRPKMLGWKREGEL